MEFLVESTSIAHRPPFVCPEIKSIILVVVGVGVVVIIIIIIIIITIIIIIIPPLFVLR